MLPQTFGKQQNHLEQIPPAGQATSELTASASHLEAQTSPVCHQCLWGQQTLQTVRASRWTSHTPGLCCSSSVSTHRAMQRGQPHIPAARGLGHPGMLSRRMSCQVLQVSWKCLDGCPQCSCTKGCRKIGDVPWQLLRNQVLLSISWSWFLYRDTTFLKKN